MKPQGIHTFKFVPQGIGDTSSRNITGGSPPGNLTKLEKGVNNYSVKAAARCFIGP